MLFNNENIHIK